MSESLKVLEARLECVKEHLEFGNLAFAKLQLSRAQASLRAMLGADVQRRSVDLMENVTLGVAPADAGAAEFILELRQDFGELPAGGVR